MDINNALQKHGELIAGLASLLGSLLAFALCVDIKGNYLLVKPGHSFLLWTIYSVSGAIYHFARSKSSGYRGPYINPVFKVVLDVLPFIPILGMLLSGVREAQFFLNSGSFKSAVEFSSKFLDSIALLFLVTSFFSGINSLKRYFSESKTARAN